MYYIYILKSRSDGKLYIGYTANLRIGYEDIKEGRYYQRDREGLLN